jgi:hypothetical protein
MRATLVLLSAFAALAFAAASTMAQEGSAAPSAATSAVSTPMDCGASTMKRHDHGAERNVPSSRSMPCAAQAAASSAKTESKPTHDHAKFHKNQ